MAILAIPGAAGAQSFTNGASSRPLTLPDAARVQVPSAAIPMSVQTPAPSPSLPPVAEAEHAPALLLQRLPARAEGWRIEGEGGELGWPLFVPPGRERGELRFRIAYRTDISVLPASSPLTLLVNGRTIGAVREPASVERVAEFVIPSGTVVPGFNAVTIRTEHRHRVDCSLAATYELWSEINPARTGLLYGDGAEPDATDLRALPLAPDGALHLRIVSSGKLGPHEVERALRGAQAVAIVSGTAFPTVDYGPALADDAVNLRLDAGEAGAKPAGMLAPGLTTERIAGQTAVTLRLGSETEAASSDPSRSRSLGSPQGLALAASQPSIDGGGGTLPLVGSEPATFGEGRRTVALPVSLPGDFFPADYDRAVLRLSGDWVPGRDTARARVAIKVNGREVASWPLPAAAQTFTRHPIHLPLGMFRPGANRVELEAILRSDREGGCEVDRRGAARLRLLASSDLVFPRLARIGRFPDLAQMAAAVASERPLRLIVPRPDRDNMAAAATLLTRMAVAQRREVPFTFAIEGAPAPGEQALIVAGAETTRPELLDIVRLNPARTSETWAVDSRERPGSAREAAVGGGSLWKRAPGCAFGSVANPDGAWTSSTLSVETTGSIDGAAASDLIRRSTDVLGRWRDALLDGLGRAPPPSAPSASEVAVLAQGSGEEGARVTLLTGRTGSLKDAATCLSTPAVWNSLAGRASFLSDGADTLRSVAATDPAFTASQPPSVLNLRLVAAGWLSTHRAAVAAGTLLLLALVTGSTAALLRRVGRRIA